MRLKIGEWCISGLILVGLAGCVPQAVSPAVPTATGAATAEPTPTLLSVKYKFPIALDCSLPVLTGRASIAWDSIRVGESHRAELEAVLKPSVWKLDATYGLWRYRAQEVSQTWDMVEACYSGDDTLTALNVYDSSTLPDRLDAWLSGYGRPDRVTWTGISTERSLVWYDRGIMVVFSLAPRNFTESVILFAPVNADSANDSWITRALPTEEGPLGDAFIDTREDPWDIAKTHPEQK